MREYGTNKTVKASVWPWLSLTGVPREQKMLKGRLPRVICQQAYEEKHLQHLLRVCSLLAQSGIQVDQFGELFRQPPQGMDPFVFVASYYGRGQSTPLSLSHTSSLAHALSLSLTHTHTLSLTHTLTLSLTHSHSHTRAHTPAGDGPLRVRGDLLRLGGHHFRKVRPQGISAAQRIEDYGLNSNDFFCA